MVRRRSDPARKVFGIGFHKTGTTSLALALRRLGYRVTGPNGVHDPDIAEQALPMALALAQRFDAFQDNPWPILFRELDQHFPDSRFVLTTRAPDRWIRSIVNHFDTDETPMRRWIYGPASPRDHEELYLERYTRHNDDVRAWFADRPHDLLEIDFESGGGWPELCSFLGHDVPDEPFPRANSAAARSAREHGLLAAPGVRTLRAQVNRVRRRVRQRRG